MTKKTQILYASLPDDMRKEEKLHWFQTHDIQDIHFEVITPDKNHNWINLADDNDWDTLLSLADKNVKLGRSKEAVFEQFSLGVVTARDEWVYDDDDNNLVKKVSFLIDVYNKDVDKQHGKSNEEIQNDIDYSIKWTRAVKKDLGKGKKYGFDINKIIKSLYRPFITKKLYFSYELNEMQYLMKQVFGENGTWNNKTIYVPGTSSTKQFSILSLNIIGGLDLIEKTQCLPLYWYKKDGTRTDNITAWGLDQFRTHYPDETISKEDIFHYTYAVLHNPAYRKKYELNLKREFPRLPFYKDFHQWAAWGKALMDLHINYETAEPFNLEEHHFEVKAEAKRQKEMFAMAAEPEELFARKPIKTRLKADKVAGIIEIDELTFLRGVPKEAWEYKLGNRSALEWILDQYKEKKPKDPTIAEKFNTYCFADYKDHVIDLLKRVCTVSVKTMEIVGRMEKEEG